MSLQVSFQFGALEIKINAPTIPDVFRKIGVFAEAPCKCAKCGGDHILPGVRTTNEGDEYFELTCKDCGCKFDLGQKKDNAKSLFPKFKPKGKGGVDKINVVDGWYDPREQSWGDDGGNQQQSNQQGNQSRGQGGGGGNQNRSHADNYRDNQQRGGNGQHRQGQQGGQGGGGNDYHDEDDIPF